MKFRYDVVSDVGRARSNNEDMALVFGAFVRDGSNASMVKMDSHPRFTAIVADGMGGYGGGEIASEMTLRSFNQFILNLPAGLDETDLRVALNNWLEAHQNAIFAEQTKPGLAQMGTTLTGIFTYEDREYIINAGDSRVYRWRYGDLRQLTVDHSERERLKDPTVPSNLIYNAIGVPNAFITITPMVEKYAIVDGDRYIICSDGLCDMIDDEAIAAILTQNGNARQLVDAALNAGGLDNCTVIVLDVSKPAEEPAPEQVAQQPAEPETKPAEPLTPPVEQATAPLTREELVAQEAPQTPPEMPQTPPEMSQTPPPFAPEEVRPLFKNPEPNEVEPTTEPPREVHTVTGEHVIEEAPQVEQQSFKDRLRTAGKLLSETFNVLTGGKK